MLLAPREIALSSEDDLLNSLCPTGRVVGEDPVERRQPPRRRRGIELLNDSGINFLPPAWAYSSSSAQTVDSTNAGLSSAMTAVLSSIASWISFIQSAVGAMELVSIQTRSADSSSATSGSTTSASRRIGGKNLLRTSSVRFALDIRFHQTDPPYFAGRPGQTSGQYGRSMSVSRSRVGETLRLGWVGAIVVGAKGRPFRGVHGRLEVQVGLLVSAFKRGLPRSRASAPNSLVGSWRARLVDRVPSWVIWMAAPTILTPTVCPR